MKGTSNRPTSLRGEPAYLPQGTFSHETGCESEEDHRSPRALVELGYYLSGAQGYRVANEEGKNLGTLERLRYGHHADYPDELIVRRGPIMRKLASIPIASVLSVDRHSRQVRVQ